MDGPDVRLFVVLLLIVAMGAAWVYRDKLMPQPEPAVIPQSVPAASEVAEDPGPRYPVAEEHAQPSAEGSLVTLPPLDDSDAYFLLALVDLFGPDVELLLAKEALIDKVVATVDNLPRNHVAEKIRPVGRLPEPFRATQAPDGESLSISPDSYERYAPLVDLIATTDMGAVVETYRRFYPLFQESYVRLGYPEGYFNDRVIEVIDHLLATPQPAEPILVVRPHVLYEYADPELESLSSGQKLLLRMGSENSEVVRRALSALRGELAP